VGAAHPVHTAVYRPAGALLLDDAVVQGLAKISHQPVVIALQLSCLPPTSVGGSRFTTLFVEPASAGLLVNQEARLKPAVISLAGSQTTN